MNFLKPIISETPQFYQIIICLIVTIILSVLFGLGYCKFKQKDGYFKDIPITLVIFPIVVCALTIIVTTLTYSFSGSSNEAKYGRVAVALISAFVIFKFRSQQRTTEDLTYLFFMTGIGLLLGMGYIWFALVLYAMVYLLIVVLYLCGFPMMSKRNLNLKVTIPEDLNYENVFDGIFERYTKYNKLTKVKTSDMGTMFVLNYEIILKRGVSSKNMIDEIREKNGNLNVVMTVKKYTSIDN